jgi:hypothetical protein
METTLQQRTARSSAGLGLRARVSDDENERWFSGEVISVNDDPAGNVTVKLRPDTLSAPGRLPVHPQRDANDFQLLLFLWLAAHGLLWLLALVLE